MGAPVIAAVVRRREREVIDDFRRMGALSPSTAKSLDEMGLADTWAFRRLCERSVIRQPQPGSYYADEEVWASVGRMRRRVALILLALFLAVAITVTFGVVTAR